MIFIIAEPCVGVCDTACVEVCPVDCIHPDHGWTKGDDAAGKMLYIDPEECIGCGLCAWSCPYCARELDPAEAVMKKCTLCVDRIYNDNLPEEDRQPACVRTCPTNARHFGDLGDPNSEVSLMVAARGGVDLMPEQDTRPVNKYLPPRPRRAAEEAPVSLVAMAEAETLKGFWKWVDTALERMG